MTAVGEIDHDELAPEWFTRAIAAQPVTGTVTVDGARIAYRAWGDNGSAPVILIHGGAANARWWDHLAPLLADGRRVVALDLSGHGRSDHRDGYRRSQWADEVMAVAAVAGARPVVVGHSLGGLVALETAARYGAELAGLVVVDSPIKIARPVYDADRERRLKRKLRVYPTPEAIMERFRPDPEDTPLPGYLRRYLGRHSFRRTSDGYTWQFDPRISMAGGMLVGDAGSPACPVALIRGERGMLEPLASRALSEQIGSNTTELTIPDSGHHVMLDQPLALAAALDALTRAWCAVGDRDGSGWTSPATTETRNKRS